MEMEPENPPPAPPIEEEQVQELTNMDILMQQTGLRKKEIYRLMESEMTNPMSRSAIMVLGFWMFMMFMGRLPLFLACAWGSYILSRSIFRKDYFQPKRRHYFKLMEIRAMQCTLMMINLHSVSFIGFIIPTKYFSSASFTGALDQMIQLYETVNFWTDVKLSQFLQISIQLYLFSLSCIFVGRTIVNLFYMCRTPTFMLVVGHEVRAMLSPIMAMLIGIVVFNYISDPNEDKKPRAQFLVTSLVTWLMFCVLHCAMDNEEIRVPRTNDVPGVTKIDMVVQCQTLFVMVILGAVMVAKRMILEAFSSAAGKGYSKNLIAYYNSGGGGKNLTNSPLLPISSLDVIYLLTAVIVLARLAEHQRQATKLQKVLSEFILDHERHVVQ